MEKTISTNQIMKKHKQLYGSLNDLLVYIVSIRDNLGESIPAAYTNEALAWGHIELEYYNLLTRFEDRLQEIKSVKIYRDRIYVTLEMGFVVFDIHRVYVNPCDNLYLCFN